MYRVVGPDGRPRALKLLTALEDARARRRFERELAALQRVAHPGIVRVTDHGEARGRPYLVMELVEGEPLDRRLSRAGYFEPRQAAALARELSAALAHAHGRDVLHRDLKPANVLLATDGRALLTDFGLTCDLAAAHHSLTRTGTFLGTPGYWSPEQATGELDRIGSRSDVYGVGAVLYAALTARPPIKADTLTEVLARTTSVPPEPPSRINPQVDASLEAICLRCLEKSPDARYPDAAALEAALEDYLGREAPVRRPLGLAAVILVGGVLGAGLLVALGTSPAAPTAPPSTPQTAPSTPAPADPRLQLEEARRLRQARELEPALALLDALIAQAPDLLDAREERAVARAMAGDQSGALADCGLVLERDASRPLSWRVQATALLVMGQLEPAEQSYTRALELDADDARTWAQRGMARRALGRGEQAREDFRRALALEPKLAPVHSALGSMAYEGQAYAEALEHLDAAIALDPTQALDRANRGLCLLNLGRPAEAQSEFLALVELTPDDPTAWALLADARLAQEDHRGAIEALSTSLGFERGLRALLTRGECHRELAELDQALADFNEALALEPGSALALRLRADLHQQRGDAEAAITDYALLLGAEEPVAEREVALNNYARALLQARRFADALAVRDELVERRGDWEAYWSRASAQLRLGRLEQALADLDRSLSLDPPADVAPRVRAGRGRTRWALGQHAQALSDLRQVLAEQPHPLHALWVALLAREPELLADYLDAPEPWGPLAAWATGQLTEAALLERVSPADDTQRGIWACRLRCYLGLERELAGDAPGARAHYQAALDTDRISQLEWSWSSNALARLR